jgi:hypothetical protein
VRQPGRIGPGCAVAPLPASRAGAVAQGQARGLLLCTGRDARADRCTGRGIDWRSRTAPAPAGVREDRQPGVDSGLAGEQGEAAVDEGVRADDGWDRQCHVLIWRR